MKEDKLIVIEGACDGIGKSTQFNLLKDHLVNDGENVVSHHFPSYGTYHGEAIERYLKGEYGSIKDLSLYFVHSLYATDRAIVWNTKLKDEYEKGSTILLDRYTISSMIYQSAFLDNLWDVRDFVQYVEDFEYKKLGIHKPDSVIFLCAPYDMIAHLRMRRDYNDGIKNDIHESDDLFMKKVYNTGMFLSQFLNWNVVECNQNDKMRSIDDIHQDVYKLVRKK